MPRPYSVDLRERVLAAVDEGHAPGDVAVQYQISERTIWNWLALREETGKLAPREGDVGPACKLEEYREQILKSITQEPDLTLLERQQKLQLPGCLTTLWNALLRWGITLKKSPPGRRTTAT